MTQSEFKLFMAGFPKRWELSRHEMNALWRAAETMGVEEAESHIQGFLAGYEGRFKPSTKQLCYALRHGVTPQAYPGSPAVEPAEQLLDLPRREAFASWHFFYKHGAAKTPTARRQAIKAYFDERDKIGKPIEGVELKNIMALLAQCDAELRTEQPAVVAPVAIEDWVSPF